MALDESRNRGSGELLLYLFEPVKKGDRNGEIGRDVSLKLSVWVAMVMLSTYLMLAPEIQRLTSLGALK